MVVVHKPDVLPRARKRLRRGCRHGMRIHHGPVALGRLVSMKTHGALEFVGAILVVALGPAQAGPLSGTPFRRAKKGHSRYG